MSSSAQTSVQGLGRAAIDPVNDGRRGRSRMMVMVVIPREQECMVLLRLLRWLLLIRTSSTSGITSATIGRLQMVMVVVQGGCCGMRHHRQRTGRHRVTVAGGNRRNFVHFAVRRTNA